MRSLLFVLLLCSLASAQTGPLNPPQPTPGVDFSPVETFPGWPHNIDMHAEQVGDGVRIYLDPLDDDPGALWVADRYFVVVRDDVVVYVDHFLRMGPPQNPHFGTDDELSLDVGMDQARPDAEDPHSYKVYSSPNPPDFSNPPTLEVRTNQIPAQTVALDLIDFAIEMPTILLPDDSSTVSVPITITADQACELTGVSFAWAFDQDRMSITGLALDQAWSLANPPSFSLLVAINEPTQFPSGYQPQTIYPGGVAYYGGVFDFMLVNLIDVVPGAPFEFGSLEVSAKPGADIGPVDFDLWNYWSECDLVPTFGCSAVTEVVYRDTNNGPNARSFDQASGGPFTLWTAPVVFVTDSTVTPLTFTPGDCDSDGSRNISDAIGMLQFLFLGGSVACEEAVDFDQDGTKNVSDAIGVLHHLFMSGPALGFCAEDLQILNACATSFCP